jgi:tetratricopeptide (TPR) repeat protein
MLRPSFGENMRSRPTALGLHSGLAFGLLLVTATSARAQPASTEPFPLACTSVSAAESDRAHLLYQAGKAYYDDANYDSAITQFREAYKKDCTKHELLIIISRAYELKSNRAAAIDALEEYLKRAPSSPDAQQHRTRIENLRKQLAAQPPAAAAAAPAATEPPVASPPAEVREHTVPPWIVVGLGGAGVIVGVVLVATTPKLPSGCDPSIAKCTPIAGETPAEYEDRQAQAGASQSQPTVGGVIAGIGGALVVGGLLWHFLEPTGPVEKTAKAKPKLAPQVAPGFAGLSLGGTF